VVEPFRNNAFFRTSLAPLSYAWAFASGFAQTDGIYNIGSVGSKITSAVYPKTDHILPAGADSPVNFWCISGSWLADFNFKNSFVRTVLAKPNYGLIVLPYSNINFQPGWTFDDMTWGRTLGESFIATLNVNNIVAHYRWLSIQGDPTLRLNPISPPTLNGASINGSNVQLSWSGGETSSYYIYRAQTSLGPWGDGTTVDVPITTTPMPFTGTSTTVPRITGYPYYMVRCAKVVNTGRGPYTVLSQGSIRVEQ